MASSSLRIFHGTSSANLDAIRSEGLRASEAMGYSSPRWYMVASDFESAAFHAPNYESHRGRPVVLEFRIPAAKQPRKWPGWPYLWKGVERSDGKSTWYALREPIPPKFLVAVHQIEAVSRVMNPAPDELTIVRENMSREQVFEMWAPSFMGGHDVSEEKARHMFPSTEADMGSWTLAWIPLSCMTYRYRRTRRMRTPQAHRYAEKKAEDTPPGIAVPKERGILYVLDGNTRVDAAILRHDSTVLMLVPATASRIKKICRSPAPNPRRRNVPAPASIKRKTLYHGTPSSAAAKKILKSRLLLPRTQTKVRIHGVGHTEPLHPGVYLTSDRQQAVRYALSTEVEEPYGYLFEVDGTALGDIEPDEDFVGSLAHAAMSYCWGDEDPGIGAICERWARGKWESDEFKSFRRLVEASTTALQQEDLEHGGRISVSMRANIGKKVLRKMDLKTRAWVASHSPSLANIGPVPIERAWKIPRHSGWKYADPRFFAQHAVPIELQPKRNPAAGLGSYGVVIDDVPRRRGSKLTIAIFDTTIPRPEDAIVAMLQADRQPVDGQDIYTIQAATALHDLGPALYEIGMHHAATHDAWLGSSNRSRSYDALQLWNKFIRRSDVTCLQMNEVPGVACRAPAPAGLQQAQRRGQEYLDAAAERRASPVRSVLRSAIDVLWEEVGDRVSDTSHLDGEVLDW
jgi:hypothetical protein